MATVDIAPGEPLLELPEHLLLSPTAALDAPAPFGPALEDCLGGLTDEEALTAYLCHEISRGVTSFFHPYLAILPPRDDLGALSCMAWDDAELTECQDPWLVEEVARRRRAMRQKHARVVEGLLRARHPGVFGSEAFAWGAWEYATLLVQVRHPLGVCVDWKEARRSDRRPSHIIYKHKTKQNQSRAFGRRLDFTSFVPLADLLNHANVQVTYSLSSTPHYEQPLPPPPAPSQPQQQQQQQPPQQRVFRLFYPTTSGSGVSVRAGAEVFNSYGRRGNAFFLLHYGFALYDNEWESVALPPPPPIPRGAPALQAAILALGERAGKVFAGTHAVAAGGFNWDLLCYARTLTAALQQEEENQQHPQQGRLDLTRPLSRAQEGAALRWLGAFLEEALAAFPTTAEEDEAALRSLEEERGPYRLRAAVTYRLTRKRVLRKQLRAVDVLMRVVEAGQQETRRDDWGALFGSEQEDAQLKDWMEALLGAAMIMSV